MTTATSLLRFLRALAGLILLGTAICAGSPADAQTTKFPSAPAAHEALAARRAALAKVETWAVQFRHIDAAQLQASPFDMVVIDHAPHPDPSDEMPFTRQQIEALKHKDGAQRRLVIAYLSIGEAERYRYYWRPEWEMRDSRPAWLGPENPNWPGNYLVNYSDPQWQSIIFGTPGSYLDRIMAAGFDGVFLDRADAFQDEGRDSPETQDAMVSYLVRLVDHARRKDPGFLIIMQNAEELIRFETLRDRLDGLAKEDLLYGGTGNSGQPNPPVMVRDSLNNLRVARKAGMSVFLISYVNEPDKVERIKELARREGFRLYFAERMLDRLNPAGATAPPASGQPQDRGSQAGPSAGAPAERVPPDN